MGEPIDVAAFTEFERAGWDRVHRDYHRFMGQVTERMAGPLLDAAKVTEGVRVLDVATGPGYIAGHAAARGARVVGVDLSQQSLELARSLHPELEFRVADALDLPFPDASFDAVVAGFLVPHLADHRRALAEFARVLAPRGAVALSTWDRPERVPSLGLLVEAVARAGGPPPPGLPTGPPFFQYSDEEALVALFREAGLVDVGVVCHEAVHRVPSAEALWEGVLAGSVRTSALLAGQPPARQAAVREAFDQLAAAYRTGGGLRLPVSVVIAHGRRAVDRSDEGA